MTIPKALEKRLRKRINKNLKELKEVTEMGRKFLHEHGYYSTTADPTDDNSNHWSNAPREEKKPLCCPVCLEGNNLSNDTPEHIKYKKMYVCNRCGYFFEIFND